MHAILRSRRWNHYSEVEDGIILRSRRWNHSHKISDII
jgi:hypothetical protein